MTTRTELIQNGTVFPYSIAEWVAGCMGEKLPDTRSKEQRKGKKTASRMNAILARRATFRTQK